MKNQIWAKYFKYPQTLYPSNSNPVSNSQGVFPAPPIVSIGAVQANPSAPGEHVIRDGHTGKVIGVDLDPILWVLDDLDADGWEYLETKLNNKKWSAPYWHKPSVNYRLTSRDHDKLRYLHVEGGWNMGTVAVSH